MKFWVSEQLLQLAQSLENVLAIQYLMAGTSGYVWHANLDIMNGQFAAAQDHAI